MSGNNKQSWKKRKAGQAAKKAGQKEGGWRDERRSDADWERPLVSLVARRTLLLRSRSIFVKTDFPYGRFYHALVTERGLLPADEWPAFDAAMRRSLPATFRAAQACALLAFVVLGFLHLIFVIL